MSRWKPDYDPSHLYFVTTTAIHHVHLFKRDVIRRLLPWRAGHEETQPGREADPQGPQGAGRRLPRLGCHHLLGRSHRRCAEGMSYRFGPHRADDGHPEAALFLGESLTWPQIIGGRVIAAGSRSI